MNSAWPVPSCFGLAPGVLVFTNLFRDQLDRYGEVDTVAAFWRRALDVSPRDATLVLNADDPSVAELATGWAGPVHWFGIDDPAFATDFRGAFDARWCACGGSYEYERRYFAHIGIWRCGRSDRRRPGACRRCRITARRSRLPIRQAVHVGVVGE